MRTFLPRLQLLPTQVIPHLSLGLGDLCETSPDAETAKVGRCFCLTSTYELSTQARTPQVSLEAFEAASGATGSLEISVLALSGLLLLMGAQIISLLSEKASNG